MEDINTILNEYRNIDPRSLSYDSANSKAVHGNDYNNNRDSNLGRISSYDDLNDRKISQQN